MPKVFIKENVFSKEKKEGITLILFHDLYDYHVYFDPLLEALSQKLDFSFQVLRVDVPGFGHGTGTRALLPQNLKWLDSLPDELKHRAKYENILVLGKGLGALWPLYWDSHDEHFMKSHFFINPLISFPKNFHLFLDHLGEYEVLSRVRLPLSHAKEWLITSDLCRVLEEDPLAALNFPLQSLKTIRDLQQVVSENLYFCEGLYQVYLGPETIIPLKEVTHALERISPEMCLIHYSDKREFELTWPYPCSVLSDKIIAWLNTFYCSFS